MGLAEDRDDLKNGDVTVEELIDRDFYATCECCSEKQHIDSMSCCDSCGGWFCGICAEESLVDIDGDLLCDRCNE